ncbi:MAG: SNF2-related protein, partial [Alphaproteobacteria bacterium]
MAVRIDDPPLIRTRPLRRARDPGEWAIHRAALEWGLADPIVIEDRDDLRSRPRWRDRVEPFHHQVDNLLTFCRRLPVTLLADDVGLGKTISAGLVASELVARRRVRRVLVVAPRLLGPQWKEELETRFGIPAIVANGRALLDAVPAGEAGAVITTYHSARDHVARIPADRFEMLVLDEAHKLRNLHGVPEPPRVATRRREVLAERRFRVVLMRTAPPSHTRLWDIYSLVELLAVARGHRNPFGDEAAFARDFVADHRSQARQLREDAKERFRAIVQGYMSRVRRADARLHFPDRHVVRRGVPPTPGELALIELVAGPVQELNALAQSSILQALASSPEACAAQLDRMARNGTFPADVAAAFRARARAIGTTAKLAGLLAIAAKLRREKPADWRM